MFIPYSTDAPVYYWPVITLAMIVINVGAFIWELAVPFESVEPYMLAIGAGLHPHQWLTCNFLHAGVMHLAGNMIVLWAFGLVVEGKLGSWKTLIVYLGIGIVFGAVTQLLLLQHVPTHCIGASAIIFGYMAMALIWAPENAMHCFLLIWYRAFFFELPIKIFVAITLGLQIFTLTQLGGALSSEFLHLVGVAVGLTVAIAMLKTNQVDCEHWDIFSVWAGRHRMTDAERAHLDAQTPQQLKEVADRQLAELEKKRRHCELMLDEIRHALREGHPIPAKKINQRFADDSPGWVLPETEMLQLLRLQIDGKLWPDAIETGREYLVHYTQRASVVRLKLAEILLEHNKAHSAIRFLSQIDTSSLDARQLEFFRFLREKAAQKKREDPEMYELSEEV